MNQELLKSAVSLDELKQQGRELGWGEEMDVEVNGRKMVVRKDSLLEFDCRLGSLQIGLITVQRKR